MESKPTYGRSPLADILAIFERQRLAQEFQSKLYKRSLYLTPPKKPTNSIDYILPVDMNLEWVPMNYEPEIFAAFGVPKDVIK